MRNRCDVAAKVNEDGEEGGGSYMISSVLSGNLPWEKDSGGKHEQPRAARVAGEAEKTTGRRYTMDGRSAGGVMAREMEHHGGASTVVSWCCSAQRGLSHKCVTLPRANKIPLMA